MESNSTPANPIGSIKPYYVYVLRSLSKGTLYKGRTSDIKRRLEEHNTGKCRYTSRYVPWELIYQEEVSTLEESVKREKYLKSAAGRRFLKKMHIS